MARTLRVGVRLDADGKGFVAGVRRGKKALDALTGSTRRSAAASRAASAAAKNHGASISVAHQRLLGYGKLILSVATAQRAFAAVLQNTVRQEQALAQVEARIRSTGAAAGLSTDEISAMAVALQNVTTFGDEEILEAQSVLLSFRNISGEVFEHVTEAALNLSIGLKQDLRSTVIQLGKALDDPVTGLTALSRSGTVFTKVQIAMVRAMVESGDLLGAQQLILKELDVQYKNSARAARETLGGALEALGNTWGDLLEIQNKSTAGLQLNIEEFNTSLRNIDVAELHRDMASIGTVTLYAAGAFGLRLIPVLQRYVIASGRAVVAATSFSGAKFAATRRAVLFGQALNLSTVATYRAANAMLFAAKGARLLRGAMAFLTGPGGLLLLAAYAAYEFATANDAVDTSLGDLPGDIDAYRESLEKLTQAQARRRLPDLLAQITAAEEDIAKARQALHELQTTPAITIRPGVVIPAATKQALSDAQADIDDLQTRLNNLNVQNDALQARLAKPVEANKPPETTATPEFITLQNSFRTELDKINDTYTKNTAIVEANKNQTDENKEALLAKIKAQKDAAVAALDGSVALATLTQRQTELSAVTDYSAQSIADQAAKTRITNSVLANYGEASDKVKQKIIDITLEIDKEERAQQRIASAYQLITQGADTYAQRLEAIRMALSNVADDPETADVDERAEALEQARLERLRLYADYELEISRGKWEAELLLAEGYHSQIEAQEASHQKRLIEERLKYLPQARGASKALVDFEKKIGTEKLQAGLAVAQEGFAIAGQYSKKAFRLSQLAGIAQAGVSIAVGVTNALAGPPNGPPYPLNYIQAALVTAAGIAQIASIRSQQPPQGYALGGVVDSPTFFSARNVARGVAGEAGPEAIIPLRRGRGGRLGVDMTGAAGNSVTVAVQIGDINVTGGDGNGVETGENIALAVQGVLMPAIKGALQEELRIGGLLNPTNTINRRVA